MDWVTVLLAVNLAPASEESLSEIAAGKAPVNVEESAVYTLKY